MKVANIRQLLSSHGADSNFLELLASVDDADDVQLTEHIRPAVIKLAKALTVERERLAKLNQTAIQTLLMELHNTKSDNAAFEDVIKRAAKNRSLKLADAVEVANQFTGEKLKFKTKTEAFGAVLKRQIADRRSAARSSQISGIF